MPNTEKLARKLLILSDALILTTRRTQEAAEVARDVDPLIEQQLRTIATKFQQSADALAATLDELQEMNSRM